MSQLYDLAIAGGGLGGAALAKSMAERGAKMLVFEREQKFRDRIRGEFLTPWGYADARALGVSECLRSCANEIRWMDVYAVTERMVHRDLISFTPQQLPALTFYHPSMQELLLGAAAGA